MSGTGRKSILLDDAISALLSDPRRKKSGYPMNGPPPLLDCPLSDEETEFAAKNILDKVTFPESDVEA